MFLNKQMCGNTSTKTAGYILTALANPALSKHPLQTSCNKVVMKPISGCVLSNKSEVILFMAINNS
jgi:hypothetical protein